MRSQLALIAATALCFGSTVAAQPPQPAAFAQFIDRYLDGFATRHCCLLTPHR